MINVLKEVCAKDLSLLLKKHAIVGQNGIDDETLRSRTKR